MHAGHKTADVLDDYTSEEVKLHYLAWVRLEGKIRRDRVIDWAIATSGKARLLSRHVKRLGELWKHTEKALNGGDDEDGPAPEQPRKRKPGLDSFFGALGRMKKKRR